jgi:hypothetical protein
MKKPDADLVVMMQDLIEKEITNADWRVTVSPELPPEKNFTLPVLQSFLDFKQEEHKAIKTADPTITNLMRRMVKVDDIEEMIMHEQNRARKLVDEAHRIEREI